MAKDHRLPMGGLEVSINEFGDPHDGPGQMFLHRLSGMPR